MIRVVDYIRASGVWITSLFKNRSRVAAISPNGHTVLNGWEVSPEERLLQKFEERRSKPREATRVALFCTAGPQAGQLLLLGKSRETLSKLPEASCVVTPADLKENATYQMLINGTIKLMSEPDRYFRLNGMECDRAELFDYDEVELLGNRFLVMTVESPSSQPQGDRR